MESLLLALYLMFWGSATLIIGVLLVYAIINRLKDRKTEDFEQRNN